MWYIQEGENTLCESSQTRRNAGKPFPTNNTVLGVQVEEKGVLPLMSLERPLPVTRTFTTLNDNQNRALFHFLIRLAPRGSGDVLIEIEVRGSGAKRCMVLLVKRGRLGRRSAPQQEAKRRGGRRKRRGSVRSPSYRIQWGDTLWRITERYYGDGDLYPLLAVENDITDPDVIVGGKDIRLPWKIDDRARIDSR
jgi:nucleoid-associated protein YgaU